MPMNVSSSFIGVDVGGTRTTAIVADAGGSVLGVGLAAGSNPRSSGTELAEILAAAVGTALEDTDPGLVRAGVVAIAGGSRLQGIEGRVYDAWERCGIATPPVIVPDVLASYRAGTSSSYGAVLVAGTGAIAARIEGGRIVRRSGGHGWIVGDEGSAVWIGTKAIAAVLRALDGRGRHTALVDGVTQVLGVERSPDGDRVMAEIVEQVYGRPPALLGQVARAVTEAMAAGDAVAAELIHAAAEELVSTLHAVIDGRPVPVVVLSGSVLTEVLPIAEAVRRFLASRCPDARVVTSRGGAAGAIAMAIERHTGGVPSEVALVRLREACEFATEAADGRRSEGSECS